jgi:hypothetical protein
MQWITRAAYAVLLFVAVPSTASAQQQMRRDLGAATDSLIATYQARLNLTDEQTEGIRTILLSQGEKGQAMFETARGEGREAMMELRPRMEELGEETSEQVEALLTEDQIPEYRKIQAEIQEQRQSRMRQRRPGR